MKELVSTMRHVPVKWQRVLYWLPRLLVLIVMLRKYWYLSLRLRRSLILMKTHANENHTGLPSVQFHISILNVNINQKVVR